LRFLTFLISLLVSVSVAGNARPQSVAGDENEVDLQLVLAVDISGSMDGNEARFQRLGYVEAFRHPDVLDAIRSGPHGRIAVTYMEWSSATHQVVILPWRVIGTEDEVLGLADDLSQAPLVRGGRTSISGGLLHAARAFSVSGVTSKRRAIDISSDGVNNDGYPVSFARDLVVGQGITVNGLPILITSYVGLDLYFEENVVGGPGAFVIPVTSRADFVPAIRRKLVLEIAGRGPEATTGGTVPVFFASPGE
jgi:hypothetical protein